ncbi:991_t:CDS:10, partial [Racocetra fulgida]
MCDNNKHLIEILEGLTGLESNVKKAQNVLLERCLNASSQELKGFFDELLSVLCQYPDVYIPTLKTYLSYLYGKYLCNSDISNNKQTIWTTERVFDEILDAHGVFGIWISDKSGCYCIKRILFEFNMIEMIDRNKALRAVDMVASLVENCSDHIIGTSQLPEKLSEYKACTALLETLTSYQDAQNLNRGCSASKSMITVKSLPLTIQDEQNFAILGMETPGKLSNLYIILRTLEKRKIDLLRVLIEFLPCGSCHRQALVYFSPDKYSYLKNESADIDYDIFLSERRLPFEFSDSDKLGPWDVLLSEDAISDMRNLKSPQMIKAVMKKFGHISSGKWDQYELRNKVVDCSSVDVYEMELPDPKGLKILWQVVKIWTVTTNQELIREMLENLAIVHQVYTNKQIQRCKTDITKDGVILPRDLRLNSTNERLYNNQDDDESLIKSAILSEKKMSFTQFCEYIKKKEEENINNNQSNNTLLEEDDEMRVLGDIPNSFRQLTDDHFPLFITYEKFSQMLEGTYEIDVNKLWKTKQEFNMKITEEFNPRSSFVDTSEKSWAHFITFDLFEKKYWNHFSDNCRRYLDPALAYAEFSIIKGSNPEVECLSREEYLAVNTKKYPKFYDRNEIYNLFERYEKMKKHNYDYDSIDRTRAVFRCAKREALGGPHIHEVYIDECQDNQIVDFSLILRLFNRATIFLAGDTAQCIARGSSFRFQSTFTISLKNNVIFFISKRYNNNIGVFSLLHQWELVRSQINPNWNSFLKPERFELNVNYRSHNGIIALAASVIDLIQSFFPNTIDNLPRERGEVGGPRPIMFRGYQDETSVFKYFTVDGQLGDAIEFGANQVIIVRDEKAKKRLEESIGKVGLILTIFEAKGMEFNDVLLYDFFTDSPAEGYSGGMQALSYERHFLLSSALKHLYVAVTRAREHIWIFDRDYISGEPIWKYWDHHGLIRTKYEEDGTSLPNLAKKSNLHEWNETGKHFFERRQYKQDIGMYKEAGDIYYESNSFESAADCYSKCDEWEKAGESYKKANKYVEAVNAYKNGGYYDNVVDLMQRQKIDDKTFRRISRFVNIHYRRGDNKEMCEKAFHIIPTQEERIEFLADHAPEELLKIYVKKKQFHDAGEFLVSRGNFEEAADMFRRSANIKDIIESL